VTEPAERSALTERRVSTGDRRAKLRCEILIQIDRFLTCVLRHTDSATICLRDRGRPAAADKRDSEYEFSIHTTPK
jgi:hypothetical protein